MKAIVLKIENGTATVLTDNGQFKTVKDHGYQPGQKIKTVSRKMAAGLVSAAACMLLMCGGLVSWFLPTGYVYMDINPSFRLNVNCYGRVSSVAALNDDAQNLLVSGKYTGAKVKNCIHNVVDACRTMGYLDTDADIQVDVCTKQSKLTGEVQSAVEELETDLVSVSLYVVSAEDNEMALESNISTGRLRALKSYTHYLGGTLEDNTEKLKNISTEEILEQICAYRRSTKGKDGVAEDGSTVRYISEKRLKAVQAYTDVFGGTLEENMRILRGTTTKEIYAMLEERAEP